MSCLLFGQHHLVLCLAMVSTPRPSNCRFQHFPNAIDSITYYSHAPHIGVTYSLSNYFIKINIQEIFVRHFSDVFFSWKQKTNIFFILFFSNIYKFGGYLFIIIITTYTLGTAILYTVIKKKFSNWKVGFFNAFFVFLLHVVYCYQ